MTSFCKGFYYLALELEREVDTLQLYDMKRSTT